MIIPQRVNKRSEDGQEETEITLEPTILLKVVKWTRKWKSQFFLLIRL